MKPVSNKRLKQLARHHEDKRNLEWRNIVLERDGKCCQYPGCRYATLPVQVHHIKKYSTSPHLRFDPNNGITLCTLHHQAVTGQEERWELFFITIVQGINSKKSK